MICYINTSATEEILADRLRSAEKKIFTSDKHTRSGYHSVCGRVLLGYMLKKEYGINSFSYRYGEKGKPYLENADIYFSISHSGDYVLCCLSESEIGCDIEKIRDFNPKIGKRFFTEKESLLLGDEKTSDDNFFKLWTLKESILKKEGTGITGGLDTYCFADYVVKESFTAHGYHFLNGKYGEYMLSVCGEKISEEPREISIGEITEYIDEINRKNT